MFHRLAITQPLTLDAENSPRCRPWREGKVRANISGRDAAKVIAEPMTKAFIVQIQSALGLLPELR
jgi:hypothetical protein